MNTTALDYFHAIVLHPQALQTLHMVHAVLERDARYDICGKQNQTQYCYNNLTYMNNYQSCYVSCVNEQRMKIETPQQSACDDEAAEDDDDDDDDDGGGGGDDDKSSNLPNNEHINVNVGNHVFLWKCALPQHRSP